MTDAAVAAQGETSARGAERLVAVVIPQLEGLDAALRAPGARMLDVGTGVGALATVFAARYAGLHVTGLDVSPHVLEIARRRADTGPAATRLSFRLGDISSLDDEHRYDLVWFPGQFIPGDVLDVGVQRAVMSLKPGGWLLSAHEQIPEDPIDRARAELQVAVFGGMLEHSSSAVARLQAHGLDRLQTFSFSPSMPDFAAGRAAAPISG